MEDIKEMEVEEIEDDEQIPESSDSHQPPDIRCTDPINLLCINCLHRLS